MSAVQLSAPVTGDYACNPFLTLSSLLVYPRRLHRVSYAIEQDLIAYPSSVIVHIYKPETPHPADSLRLPLGSHKLALYVCESASVLQTGS